MSKTLKYIVVAMLAVVLVIPSPMLALAKENGKENGNGKNKTEKFEKREKDEDRSKSDRDDDDDNDDKRGKNNEKIKKNNISWVGCVTKSFGHLIAPGWIKKNGQITVSDDCSRDGLPKGIAWLYGYHSTSTPPTSTSTNPDTKAPVLSNIKARMISTSTAIISWDTNEKSDSVVWYSTVSPVNTATATTANKTDLTRNHNIHISGLSASTTYYFIVRSKDASSNTSTSSEISFKTLSIATTTPVAPVISNIVATVGTSTVKIAWNTDVSANSTVFYGTSTPLNISASTTASTTNSTLVTSHDMNVTGLATSTTYYFVVQSKNSVGTIKNSNQFSLTTSF